MIKKLLFIVFSAVLTVFVSAADDFSILVKNYNKFYFARKADVPEVDRILAEQNPDGSFKTVMYSDKSCGVRKWMKHWSKLSTPVGAWNSTGKQNIVMLFFQDWLIGAGRFRTTPIGGGRKSAFPVRL